MTTDIAAARGRLKIFFDGGCRPNPGLMEAAVVVRGAVHLFDDLGRGTNSDAEWMALICALELMRSLHLTGVTLLGDSAQIIQQANRALTNHDTVSRHAATFAALASQVPPARIRWVKRAQNLAGIALAARHR